MTANKSEGVFHIGFVFFVNRQFQLSFLEKRFIAIVLVFPFVKVNPKTQNYTLNFQKLGMLSVKSSWE